MAVWLTRAGAEGEHAGKFLADGRIYATWDHLRIDLSTFSQRQALIAAMLPIYPDTRPRGVGNWASQLWGFAREMQIGDLVILPLKDEPAIRVGVVTGPYEYDAAAADLYWHSRTVDWEATPVPRERFGEDLLNSFGAFLTICRIRRNNAEQRVVAMRDSGWQADEGMMGTTTRASSLGKGSAHRTVDQADALLAVLYGSDQERTVALGELVRAIRVANAAGAASWVLTLRRRLVRLNVGGGLILDLVKGGIRVTVADDLLSDELRNSLAGLPRQEFRWVPGAVQYELSCRDHVELLPKLHEANDEIMRRAASAYAKSPWHTAHSPALMEVLRRTYPDLPDPAYLTAIPRYDDQEDASDAATDLENLAEKFGYSPSELKHWVTGLQRKKQAIFAGPPGTGKTFVARQIADYLAGPGGIVETVQFHPAFAYEDFMQGLRPVSNGGSLSYEMRAGRFLSFCERAKTTKGTAVLIIDEINRANIPQVFGELMYLLEYRDEAILLASGMEFRIPENVRIIGTMNTADRSIALLDHALQRRFAYFRLDPNPDVLTRFHEETGFDVDGLLSVLAELNTAIDDPDYAVGVSYFTRDDLDVSIEAIWKDEVEAYLAGIFDGRRDQLDRFRWKAVRTRIVSGE